MAEDTKNNPAYKCKAYGEMELDWETVEDLSAGARKVRDKGAKYLPVEPAEDRGKDYPIRLSRALLFNAFERTLNGLVGMAFRKEPKLGTDVPEIIRGREEAKGLLKLEGWAENIDLQGAAWTVFAKETFTDAMRLGHSFIYTDMPPKLPTGATLADERAAGRRPYWVSYRASQALNWRGRQETRAIALSNGTVISVPTGRRILEQITFEECSYEPDGKYGEKEVKRYRVLSPGYWYLYEEVKTETGTDYLLIGEKPSSYGDFRHPPSCSNSTSSAPGDQLHRVVGRRFAASFLQPPARLFAIICLNIAVRAGALIFSPCRIATVRAVLLLCPPVIMPCGSGTIPPSYKKILTQFLAASSAQTLPLSVKYGWRVRLMVSTSSGSAA